MGGPEPRWPDPTRPEKSRRPHVFAGVRSIIAIVVVAVTFVTLLGTVALRGGGSDAEPRGTGATSTEDGSGTEPVRDLWLEVRSTPPRAFRDPVSRQRLMRETKEAAVATDEGFPMDAIFRLRRVEPHLNGCLSASGAPDADDWVVDCAAQNRMRRQLDGAIISLRG